MTYAGFWKRVAASLIDTFVTLIVLLPVAFVMGFLMGASGVDLDLIEISGNILGFLVGWLYYTVMESSKLQGTFGKLALGIKVTDLDGNQISCDFSNSNLSCSDTKCEDLNLDCIINESNYFVKIPKGIGISSNYSISVNALDDELFSTENKKGNWAKFKIDSI